jgi:hypothetical protein
MLGVAVNVADASQSAVTPMNMNAELC